MTTEPVRDLAHQLSRAERLLSGRVSALLEAEHCTLEEWRVLKFLSDQAGHSMSEIADYAMLPAPTLTKLMDRMVSEGLVYRRADDRDRRRVVAHLAGQGHLRYQRTAAVMAAAELELTVRLGDPGPLSRLLTRLAEALSEPPASQAEGVPAAELTSLRPPG
jgi:DNA-binding MarR family transcriptional regulator